MEQIMIMDLFDNFFEIKYYNIKYIYYLFYYYYCIYFN